MTSHPEFHKSKYKCVLCELFGFHMINEICEMERVYLSKLVL